MKKLLDKYNISQNDLSSVRANIVDSGSGKSSQEDKDQLISIYEANKTGRNRTDIKDFFGMVKDVLDVQNENKHIKLQYAHIFPDKVGDAVDPIITFEVSKRSPAVFEQTNNITQASIKNRNFITRQSIIDPEDPKFRVIIEQKGYDNIVVFKIWSRSPQVAMDQALLFENMIDESAWFFSLVGGIKVFHNGWFDWMERESSNNDRVFCIPISYLVRTNKIRVIREKTIDVFNITASVEKEQ